MDLYNLLNQLLCDLTVGSRVIQTLHWNLQTDDFIYYHPYLGDIYDKLVDQIDITAERIRFQKMFPFAKLEECVRNSDIEEIDSLGPYGFDEGVDIALKVITTLNENTKALVTFCDENKLWALVQDFSDFLTAYEKILYFLNSSMED